MNHLITQPILAAGGEVMGVVILIIAFIGWVMNIISSKNQEEQKRQRRPQRAPRKRQTDYQNEDVEVFLDEVNQRRQPRRRQSRLKKQQQKPEPVNTFLEVVEEEPREMGSSLRDHLSENHLGEGIQQSVDQHLGGAKKKRGKKQEMRAVAMAASSKPGNRAGVLALLSDPNSVKQAMMVSEILSPPKALRSRK